MKYLFTAIIFLAFSALAVAGDDPPQTQINPKTVYIPKDNNFDLNYGKIMSYALLTLDVLPEPNCRIISGSVVNPSDRGWTGSGSFYTCALEGQDLSFFSGVHQGYFKGQYICGGGSGGGDKEAKIPEWKGKAKSTICADLWLECPLANRVARPGYDPASDVNGCGPEAGWVPIPDGLTNLVDFTPACNTHDKRYGTCKYPKADADNGLRQDMLAACAAAGLPGNIGVSCEAMANIYYAFVSTLGQTAYDAAQRKGCVCCP